MNPTRKWILAPLALACAAGAYAGARHLGGDGAGAVARWFATHRFAAAMITFGSICAIEMGVCKLLRLGEPVIGATIITWIAAVCLTVSFFTVFALTALFSRAMGKNRLPKYAPGAASYWLPREQTPITIESLTRQ